MTPYDAPPMIACSHCATELAPARAFWRWHRTYRDFPLCIHCARLQSMRFTAASAIAEAQQIIRTVGAR